MGKLSIKQGSTSAELQICKFNSKTDLRFKENDINQVIINCEEGKVKIHNQIKSKLNIPKDNTVIINNNKTNKVKSK